MPGQYDRNRNDQGRFGRGSRGQQDWRDRDDRDDRGARGERQGRENYGREQEPPRDDRGRFMSEGERGPYYGGADYDDYGDRNYGERYEARGEYQRNPYPGGQEYDREVERDFGNYQSSYDADQRVGGRDQPRDGDYFQGSQRGYDSQGPRGGGRRGSMEWREQDYDDRRGLGQSRGRYADPQDQGREPRDRWQGSGGSRWDENDRRGREQARDPRGEHQGSGRERDEQGRFTRDDEDDRRSVGNSSARDPRGSQHPGNDEHRGWFGDARGHAQAARLGWRHRGH